MFSNETVQAIRSVAVETGIDPAALFAVAEIESGGRTFVRIGERKEPLIRFEGHYFDRRLSAEDRQRARRDGLASPNAGAIANPRTQAARWRLLKRAAAIDRKAAYESTSWGLGQVMGAHWAWLGYADVDALVAEARSGACGQARLMARYIERAGLVPALRTGDWAAFARGYNGPAYRRNRYDLRLEAGYRRHRRGIAAAPEPAAGPALRQGSHGQAVHDLQLWLTALGHPLRSDGIYGRATAAAVRRFQKEHGLIADGIAGPKTQRSLREAQRKRQSLSALWRRIRAFLLARLFGEAAAG